jgi:hypothetical protein
MSAQLARIALDRPARCNVNRLTGDDLCCIAQSIADALEPLERPASIAEDFNRIARGAPRSIGLHPADLRQSECDEIADMVAAAILDHAWVTA